MDSHDITSYPLKLPFIRSSKMAKRDSLSNDIWTQPDDGYSRPSLSNENLSRRIQVASLRRGGGGMSGPAPIEIQLENFRRKAIEMGFSQTAPASFESSDFSRPAYPVEGPSDFFPSVPPRPSAYRGLGETTGSRFHMGTLSASQPPFAPPFNQNSSGPLLRSNLDRAYAPTDISLTEDDSPLLGSQFSQRHRPFPTLGEPSTLMGALAQESGSSGPSLPSHCRWTDLRISREPVRARRQGSASVRDILNEYKSQRHFSPTLRKHEATNFSSPPQRANFSLETTAFASPRPPWKPLNDDNRSVFSPWAKANVERNYQRVFASQPSERKKFKSATASFSPRWESEDDASPQERPREASQRPRGHVSLSPIARSTPCPVLAPSRPLRPPPQDPASAPFSPRYHSPKRHCSAQTELSSAVFVPSSIDTGVQTDCSTNMPIYREVGCPSSPLPHWSRCESCGCHRVKSSPLNRDSGVSPPEDERPACRSISSAENGSQSLLNDLLIGITREE